MSVIYLRPAQDRVWGCHFPGKANPESWDTWTDGQMDGRTKKQKEKARF